MANNPDDWLHIGTRDLRRIASERAATASRSRRFFHRRGGGVTVMGFGGAVTPPVGSGEANPFDLARETCKWLPTAKDSASTADRFLDLEPRPVYLHGGPATFRATTYPPPRASDTAAPPSVAYVSRLGVNNDAGSTALMVLVGSRRHSRFGQLRAESDEEWASSTYEGLKYLVWLANGAEPANYDPFSGLRADSNSIDTLAAECLRIDMTADVDATVDAQFAARIHAVIDLDATTVDALPAMAGLIPDWSGSLPAFFLVGAPLWLYSGPQSLL